MAGVCSHRGRLVAFLVTLLALLWGGSAAAQAPQFKVDPFWPKPLPGNWILGQVAGIAVDSQDNIWILHRPSTLVDLSLIHI